MTIKLKNKLNKLFINTKAKLLSTQILYTTKFISLLEETYLLPNNKTIKKQRIIKNKDKESVIIIAITKDNKYLLVSQNRINNILTLEFPSGYIEVRESINKAVLRELKEETGYISDNIILLDRYHPNISIDSSIINIVIAYNCKKQYNQNLGNSEYINYEEFTHKELEELINKDIITSGGNKLAFYKYIYYLNNNYKYNNNCKILKPNTPNIDTIFKK